MGQREDAEALGYKNISLTIPAGWKDEVERVTGIDPATLNIVWVKSATEGFAGNKGSLLGGMPLALGPAAQIFLDRGDVIDVKPQT